MGSYVHVVISAEVTDIQKRLLKRIFILPKEPTDIKIHYLNHDLFVGYDLDLTDLENGLLYMVQCEGPNVDIGELEELSEILGETELHVKTYDEGSGDLDEVPEYSTWINGSCYSEDQMWERNMAEYIARDDIYGVITRFRKVMKNKWTENDIRSIVKDIKAYYKVT